MERMFRFQSNTRVLVDMTEVPVYDSDEVWVNDVTGTFALGRRNGCCTMCCMISEPDLDL